MTCTHTSITEYRSQKSNVWKCLMGSMNSEDSEKCSVTLSQMRHEVSPSDGWMDGGTAAVRTGMRDTWLTTQRCYDDLESSKGGALTNTESTRWDGRKCNQIWFHSIQTLLSLPLGWELSRNRFRTHKVPIQDSWLMSGVSQSIYIITSIIITCHYCEGTKEYSNYCTVALISHARQSDAQNSPSQASIVHEPRTSRCSSWI